MLRPAASTEILKSLLERDFRKALSSGLDLLTPLHDGMLVAPAGNCGPYFALESPVKTTCHWIAAYLIGERLFDEARFGDTADRLARWILKENTFFRENAFLARQRPGSDWVNGVIGPAWVIEALARLRRYHSNTDAGQLGDAIAESLPEYRRSGLFRRHDPFTKRFTPDLTFDHQGWLAAAKNDLGQSKEARRFLDMAFAVTFGVRANGRARHVAGGTLARIRFINAANVYRAWRAPVHWDQLEIGYHIYTIYPLARLNVTMPKHQFFESEKWQRALSYCTVENLALAQKNPFAFAYNAPGYELPYLYWRFADRMPIRESDVINIYQTQCKTTMDDKTGLHMKNTPDPMTLAARIYEIGLLLEAMADQSDSSNGED